VDDWVASLETTELTTAYHAWQHAVEAYNDILYDTRVDYEGYIEDRSEKWQESERGQQVQEVADELERATIEPEADQPLILSVELDRVIFVVTYESAEDVLPATSDLPEEIEA
jgi:hypothetical protein